MSTLIGCDCVGPCDPASTTCSCLKRQNEYSQGYLPGFQYDTKGRIRNHGIPIFECNAHCSCDDEECRNRVVQKGRKCEVVLRKTEMKGWGVFAKAKILAGTFIGIYSGEFILESECERRGLVYDRSGRTYLLDIDFYNVKRKFGATVQYGVDAYHVGNFTRFFFNHSCDPNCRVCPCYINEPDERRPLIVFFATRDIAVDEEICFSYSGKIPGDEGDDESQRGSEDDDYKPDDDDNLPSHKQKNACYCGASNCTGKMFND
ncbi:SET domain-containing protein [Mycena amicta]|nr:SET domain-containing protein [Mycena amicta]